MGTRTVRRVLWQRNLRSSEFVIFREYHLNNPLRLCGRRKSFYCRTAQPDVNENLHTSLPD